MICFISIRLVHLFLNKCLVCGKKLICHNGCTKTHINRTGVFIFVEVTRGKSDTSTNCVKIIQLIQTNIDRVALAINSNHSF